MAKFVEYQLEDGTQVLVKIPDDQVGGPIPVNRGHEDTVIFKTEKKLHEAMEGVHRSALVIKQKLQDLQADEVEVKFGLVTTGKLGNFAIAEVGVEANYEITMKWKNGSERPQSTRRHNRTRNNRRM